MGADSEKILNQLSNVVSIIPVQYVDALLAVNKKLDKNIPWALSGDLAESLRVVKVDPDCIEILTSKEGAKQIFEAVKEYAPEQVSFKTLQLPRNAVVGGKEYPVYVRSHYFEFNIGAVKVKVQGDLQYKVDDWDWGDKLEFTPEHVYVVGKKIAAVPLAFQYDIYQSLGWADRAEKIGRVISSRRPRPLFR